MKKDTIILIGAGVAAYFIIDALSKNKASQTIPQSLGQSAGETVGNTLINAPIGFVEGIWDVGYNYGSSSKSDWLNYLFTPLMPYQLSKDIRSFFQ